MNYWFSPFILDNQLLEKLSNLRYEKITDLNQLPNNYDSLLLIYEPPHKLISNIFNQIHENINININEGYKLLLKHNKEIKSSLVAGWHLKQLSPDVIINNEITNDKNLNINSEDISPLFIYLAYLYYLSNSNILDEYLNVELQANLYNREPDINYLESITKFQNQDFLNTINYLIDQKKEYLNEIENLKKEKDIIFGKFVHLENDLFESNEKLKVQQENIEKLLNQNKMLEEYIYKSKKTIQRLNSILISIIPKKVKRILNELVKRDIKVDVLSENEYIVEKSKLLNSK